MKRTKPRQAASPRTLDRWQREVATVLHHLAGHANAIGCSHCRTMVGILTRLLDSMQRSERR